jgi:hypothetical protein
MKFCPRPFQHLYIGDGGIAKQCSWIKGSGNLGSLLEKDVESLWRSEAADSVRDSIASGSFSFCDRKSCKFLNNDSLPDFPESRFVDEVEKLSPDHPTHFNLAFDEICNHACPTCRSEIFRPDEDYRQYMTTVGNKLLPYLQKARLIMACGRGDLFASRDLLELLGRVRPEDPGCEIRLETNGVLLESRWEAVAHFEKYRLAVTVTPNSFNRYTYRNLSGGKDNLDQMLGSLAFASKLRGAGKIAEFNITVVVQDRNFRELPHIIGRSLEEYGADKVTLRPVLPWFRITPEDYWFKNLLNPLHPYHEEYLDVMSDPACCDPRVFHWNGDAREREPVALHEILPGVPGRSC